MKNAAWIFVAAILMAGVPFAQEAPPVEQDASTIKKAKGGDELVKEKGRFQETWVRPDVDITQYSKLYPWQAVFQFRDVGDAKNRDTTISNTRSEGPYGIRDESKKKFEQVVGDGFVKALGQSKYFQVVDEVGPDTLIVRAAVLDIISDVPPKYTGFNEIYLSAVGEATFVFELIDSETGVIQARVAERRRIQPPGRMNTVSTVPTNSATVWSDVTLWANQVGQDMRRALDKAYKKASK